jgi:hypothetical protein
MTKPIGKSCPIMHFGEKLGNAQTRQHAIEPPSDTLGFVGFVLADRADRKSLFGNHGVGELSGSRDRIDFLEPGFEKSDAIGAPLIEATGNGEPQFVFPLPLPRFEYFRWQKKIIERPERAAAFDPDITGSQTASSGNSILISPQSC